jgi:hypothetical protein
MKLKDYLLEGESIIRQVEAFDSADAVSDTRKGTLACTPNRVVYVQGDDVIDISLNGVNSIEYSGPSYPRNYLYSGGFFALLAILSWISGSVLDSGPDLTGLAVICGVIGVVTLGWGLFVRRATIKLRTPNKTYEFASKDNSLKSIGHALRGHEIQK